MPIRSTKICRRKIALRYEVLFAIVRSTNHGLICLALPSKLFEVDLTVCKDISPNPGPELAFEWTIPQLHKLLNLKTILAQLERAS